MQQNSDSVVNLSTLNLPKTREIEASIPMQEIELNYKFAPFEAWNRQANIMSVTLEKVKVIYTVGIRT